MKRNKGFTLLEVVIALAILAIGLVGVLSLFPVGFQASRKASALTEATIQAQKQMETFKLEGYSYLDTTYTDGTWSSWTDFADGTTNGWRVRVTEVDPPGNLKQVELEIRWEDVRATGGYRYEKFVTYIAKL